MVRDFLEALGLNPLVLAAGGAGGLLRALSSRQHTLRERLVSPVCGALAAGYLTPVAVHVLRTYSVPLPFEDPFAVWGAAGFVIGVSAMWISDAFMLFVLQRLGKAA